MDTKCMICLDDNYILDRHFFCTGCTKVICEMCLRLEETSKLDKCPHCRKEDFFGPPNAYELMKLFSRDDNEFLPYLYNKLGCISAHNGDLIQAKRYFEKSTLKRAKKNLYFMNKGDNLEEDIRESVSINITFDDGNIDLKLNLKFPTVTIFDLKSFDSYLPCLKDCKDMFKFGYDKFRLKKDYFLTLFTQYHKNKEYSKSFKLLGKYMKLDIPDKDYRYVFRYYQYMIYSWGCEDRQKEGYNALLKMYENGEHEKISVDIRGLFYREIAWVNLNIIKDYDMAMEFFKKGFEIKHICCTFSICNMYANGTGVDKDLNKAIDYLYHAKEFGENLNDKGRSVGDFKKFLNSTTNNYAIPEFPVCDNCGYYKEFRCACSSHEEEESAEEEEESAEE